MKQGLFDASSDLKLVKVFIDDNEVLNENMQDIEIHWNFNKFEVQATMMIVDNANVMNLFTDFKEKKVKLQVTDLSDVNFEREFHIMQIKTTKLSDDNIRVLNINLIDTVSYILKNTFYSKGYSGIKLSAVIEDIFSIFKIDSAYDTSKIKRNFEPTNTTYEKLVIPGDRSLYDFFDYQLNQEGFIWFQQKNSYEIKHISSVYPSASETKPERNFSQDVENPKYLYKILDVTTDFNNTYDNLRVPIKSTWVYDPLNKKIIENKSNLADLYDDMNMSLSKELYIQNTDGVQQSYDEVNSGVDMLSKETFFNYIQNTTLELFVPGVMDNVLFERRGVKIIGSTLHSEEIKSGDEILNGDYLVLSIHDKIAGTKMIQKINVGRVNNTDKKKV
jgi:hypothetical protein